MSSKMKCPKCGSAFWDGKTCGDCNFVLYLPERASDIGTCRCGQRGRSFVPDGSPPVYECYWCHHRKESSKFLKSSKDHEPKRHAYSLAVQKYYSIPLYYGDDPNFDKLYKAEDEFLGIKRESLPNSPSESIELLRKLRLKRL